jgi:hypothetical protein
MANGDIDVIRLQEIEHVLVLTRQFASDDFGLDDLQLLAGIVLRDRPRHQLLVLRIRPFRPDRHERHATDPSGLGKEGRATDDDSMPSTIQFVRQQEEGLKIPCRSPS